MHSRVLRSRVIPVDKYLVTCIKGFLLHKSSVFIDKLAEALGRGDPFRNSVLPVAFHCSVEDKASRLGQLFERPSICFFAVLHLVLTGTL